MSMIDDSSTRDCCWDVLHQKMCLIEVYLINVSHMHKTLERLVIKQQNTFVQLMSLDNLGV